jgi:hypothetical protein
MASRWVHETEKAAASGVSAENERGGASDAMRPGVDLNGIVVTTVRVNKPTLFGVKQELEKRFGTIKTAQNEKSRTQLPWGDCSSIY